VIEVIEAHEGAIWSLHIKPDRTSLASGSADKLVKFWDMESATRSETDDTSSKPVSLVHVRTLKLANDVLAIRFSPNNKYLAVATLDSTVQIFYQDTLKFYLSLYGHKVFYSSIPAGTAIANLMGHSASGTFNGYLP
jgi:U3 small nucleolar RNA-associated protein 12